MKIVPQGNYLRILPEDTPLDPVMFLGFRKRKNDPWYTVEDNLVNRIVLGMDLQPILQENHSLDSAIETVESTLGLLDYQVKDVRRMCQLPAVLNANPMGLGKTLETIRCLAQHDAKSVLIVTPKIIREQWAGQIKKWWSRDALIYEKQQRVDIGNIWIVNYDKLRNEKTLMKFKMFQWDALILDEAHKIKSRTSKQTVAVKNIPARRRIALTGTPILRYIDDLWSLLHFLDWRYSGISYWNFVNYFCTQQHTPWGDKIVGLTNNPAKVAILNKLTSLVSVRNNAVEVAHGKTIEVVRLPMTKAQRMLYRDERALLLDKLPDNCTIANGAVLTMRLRQTTSWPGLFIDGEAGPKFEWILEACQNNPNEKFVVFSTFEKTAKALVKYLQANNVSAVSITGTNTSEENERHKRMFVDKDTQVLVGTIGAMGQGYDELQYVSRLMIFIDRDWSPEIMKQAEDRLHRMGQQHPVCIYYLECQGSFDQHVGRINSKKSDDIREALADD